jgi:hypothetical protein
MSRGKASGYVLNAQDAAVVLAMQARGDRAHDIAGWFGVNQGRVAEVKGGQFGNVPLAPAHSLPPKGAPGVKGRRLRVASDQVLTHLQAGDAAKAIAALQSAKKDYDANEA